MTEAEAALKALADALAAAAAQVSPALPAAHRNETLPARLIEQAPGLFVWLNIWDGTPTVTNELLGLDVMLLADAAARPYEIERKVLVDYAIAGGSEADRVAAFYAGLKALVLAIRPAQVGAETLYLGGAVNSSAVDGILGDGFGTITEGLPGTFGAQITIVLTYTSSLPF
jgi:hypothetical protein